MDKKKILSSLAAAGILTASVLGANVNASTNLESVGVYKNLVAGKTVVPYVLKDSETPVTVRDVKAEFGNLQLVNGNAVTSEDVVLGTGNTFKANNVEYTVLVYGDVNGDGKLSTADARLIQKVAMESKDTSFNAVQTEAADVDDNDGKISTKDARAIQQFVMKNQDTYINKLPAEEPVEESNYSLTVNDNGYINTENVANTVLNVSLDETQDEAQRLTVKITGKDNNGDKIEETETITIPAHTDFVKIPTTFDFTDYANGDIKIELLDGETVVATVTAEKNTVVPNATKVITDRVNTKKATLSLEACGDSDVTKVYYVVAGKDETISNKEDLVNEIAVSGNKISGKIVSNELDTDTAYKLFYVLENSYGSKSEIKSVMITSDSNDVKQADKVKEITVPNLEKSEVNFTWTGVNDDEVDNYIVTLYKDGNAVAEKTIANNAGADVTVEFVDNMKEAGTYKIAVYTEATELRESSEVTESEEVTIGKLAAVTGLEFRNEDDKVMLSWKNSNEEESFKEYKIELYTIDEDGNEVLSYTVDPALAADKNELDVTAHISNNTIYIAKVTVVANGDTLATISSDETVSGEFYKVGIPSIADADTTETTVTLQVSGINIPGKTTTYQVKIFNVNEGHSAEEPALTLDDTRDVEVKDGKIVIDDLDSNSPYAFKLVAIVDGEKVESDYTTAGDNGYVVRTLPELTDLTVVANEKDAEDAGKVYVVDADTIKIAGETIDLANYNNSAKLADSMKLLGALEAGDEVSIEGNNITLKLDGGASASVAVRDLSGLDLKDATIDIESNDFSKTIYISEAKEVILRGTDSIFNIDGVTAEKITLTDGVEVVGDTEYTISANSTVIINGASVTTEEETVINASGNSLTVTINEKSNDLVFENKKNDNLTIFFDGNDEYTSVQSGSIVIKSTGGTVTVRSDSNVSADLTIEVNSGIVDINQAALTGDKNVTVSVEEGKTSTIKAIAKTNAPVDFSDGVSVDVTDEELRDYEGVTDDNFDEVKDFLASFGLNGTGATITVAKGSNQVTITFAPEKDNTIENVEIGNLK